MGSGAALVFTSGTRIGALPLQHVRETMRPMAVEPIESTLPFVEGLAIVRGEPVPVLNVDALLRSREGALRGVNPRDRSPVRRFVTVHAGERNVALAVGDVLGIYPNEALDLSALPALFDGGDAIAAIGKLDGRLVSVLRAASLVPSETWAVLEARRG